MLPGSNRVPHLSARRLADAKVQDRGVATPEQREPSSHRPGVADVSGVWHGGGREIRQVKMTAGIETQILFKQIYVDIPMQVRAIRKPLPCHPLRPASAARPQPLNPGYSSQCAPRAQNVIVPNQVPRTLLLITSLLGYDAIARCSRGGRQPRRCTGVGSPSGGSMRFFWRAAYALALGLSACTGGSPPPAPSAETATSPYLIGPGDTLTIFVWRNPELSTDVTVRPDGRVSMPLVEDIIANGKTPSELAREVEKRLSKYLSKPLVTVMQKQFVGPFNRQIRIIGEAVQPKAIPYRANMTLLDAMIEVGGLTRFAAGDRATLVRTVGNQQATYSVHVDSLIRDGDIQSNVPLSPGDIIIIPQRFF